MAEITAAAVKALRDKTDLPMMECKKALLETNGDMQAAEDWLRKQGLKIQATRSDRATSEGRIAVVATDKVGTMIELQCESAPVTSNEEFLQLTKDLAQQLANGPGAATPDDLLKQASPSQKGKTLGQQKDELFNKIREVFNLSRIVRFDGPCAAYVHHDGKTAALVQIVGGDAELGKEIAMHVVAIKPKVLNRESLDPAMVAKEREILSDAARKEGKPENIIEKMIEGRMRNYYGEVVLLDQPFMKDDKTTVGKLAESKNAKIERFELWRLG